MEFICTYIEYALLFIVHIFIHSENIDRNWINSQWHCLKVILSWFSIIFDHNPRSKKVTYKMDNI